MAKVEHWVLGWPVSCAKMRASIKGLYDQNPNHTCVIGSNECTYEIFALTKLRHFSDRWRSYICNDPRLPGKYCVRYVVELESDTDREKLEAKLPVEMSEGLQSQKALGRFLGEPAVFLRRAFCYDNDGDSLDTPQAQVG